MRFIHTADLHLDKSFVSVGSKGKKLREGQLTALEKITELAKAEDVDVLVIAGDLFDSNEVSGKTVRKAVGTLKSINPIPVLIIAGTHDVLDDGSVYRRDEFREASNVKIFGIDGEEIIVGNTSFHGRSNDTKEGGVRPLTELSPNHDTENNVALIHASVEIEGKSNPNDYLVSMDEIASSGMDYVALGHWHRKADFTSGNAAAFYSGAPECTKYDESDGSGQVLLVNIMGGTISVKNMDIGYFDWRDERIDISIHPPGGPLEGKIKRMSGTNVLLRARLEGVLPEGHLVDSEELEEELSDGFFHLEVDTSGIGFPIEDVERLFADGTIGALYVERLKGLLSQAESREEKELLEEALYLGAGYIAGKLEVS